MAWNAVLYCLTFSFSYIFPTSILDFSSTSKADYKTFHLLRICSITALNPFHGGNYTSSKSSFIMFLIVE